MLEALVPWLYLSEAMHLCAHGILIIRKSSDVRKTAPPGH